MRWVAEAIAVVGLLSAIVDLGVRLRDEEEKLAVSEVGYETAVLVLSTELAECISERH